MATGEQWQERLATADIVQIHFWNTPAIYSFCSRLRPAARTLIWLHINGEFSPQVIPAKVGSMADFVIASDAATLRLPAVAAVPGAQRDVICPGADFDRLSNLVAVEHPTFNVGYIGALAFSKMHQDYIAMHASIDVPDMRVLIYGEGREADTLKRQVQAMDAESRFVFPGYAYDIRSALAGMDVFGYPLSEHNYGTGELIVREVMYAGIPAVVLPFGGAARQVEHGHTGIVVRDAAEYGRAIRELFENPAERARLGRNAASKARQEFGAEPMARGFSNIYERMMRMPKRVRQPLPARSTNTEFAASNKDAGAQLFVRSLGEHGADFLASLENSDDNAARLAEERISGHGAALLETTLTYRNYFPNDAQLRLWSGLMLLHMGRPAIAAAEFHRAIMLGCDHWRSHWYLAQAAEQSGSPLVAAEARTIARERALSFGIVLE